LGHVGYSAFGNAWQASKRNEAAEKHSLQLYNFMTYFGQKPEGDGKPNSQSRMRAKSKANNQ